MQGRERIGGEEDQLDELRFEPMLELEPATDTGLILDSLRRREPTRIIR